MYGSVWANRTKEPVILQMRHDGASFGLPFAWEVRPGWHVSSVLFRSAQWALTNLAPQRTHSRCIKKYQPGSQSTLDQNNQPLESNRSKLSSILPSLSLAKTSDLGPLYGNI